jgi:hypothetical protein
MQRHRQALTLFLLLGALWGRGLTAGEQPRASTSDDLKKVSQPYEQKARQAPADFTDRCRKMLDMQIAVYEDTRRLHSVIQSTPDKKPRPKDQQACLELAGNEQQIVIEVTKIILMLEKEGTAVAFPEVFRELRKDMKSAQQRLTLTDVGMDTQAIEQDIVDTLREMVSALKK